jgi:hypothetical protein
MNRNDLLPSRSEGAAKSAVLEFTRNDFKVVFEL